MSVATAEREPIPTDAPAVEVAVVIGAGRTGLTGLAEGPAESLAVLDADLQPTAARKCTVVKAWDCINPPLCDENGCLRSKGW